MEQISSAEARRIALAAQGFGARRPGAVTATRWLRTIERLSLHQIDSVNILARAHYLPAFSRLGPYDRSLIDTAAWGAAAAAAVRILGARSLARAARPAPAAALAHGQGRPRRGRLEGPARLRDRTQDRGRGRAPRAFARRVLRRLRLRGNSRAAAGLVAMIDAKQALEWLFWAGHITTATRRGSFERVYDLTVRVIPAKILALPTPGEAEAHRALIERAARALGVATALELRDYFVSARRRPDWRSRSWSNRASCCRSRSAAGIGRRSCTATPGCRAPLWQCGFCHLVLSNLFQPVQATLDVLSFSSCCLRRC